MSKYKQSLGRFGEEKAANFLTEKGYRLLKNNWQKRCGEIDLIMLHNEEIVFIEVKTRRSKDYGYGECAIDDKKRQKISDTIELFFVANPAYEKYSPRFEIIIIDIIGLKINFIHYDQVEL